MPEIWDHGLKKYVYQPAVNTAMMKYESNQQPYSTYTPRDKYEGSRCQTCTGCGYCSSI